MISNSGLHKNCWGSLKGEIKALGCSPGFDSFLKFTSVEKEVSLEICILNNDITDFSGHNYYAVLFWILQLPNRDLEL